ncbi:DUF354 domain-containing protein [soil metagenome]
MRYLFYLAHPAHFHLFKYTISGLKAHGHEIKITIKSKDVLPKLLEESGLEFTNIASVDRKDSRIGILKGFLSRNYHHFRLALKFKPDLYISTSAEFAPIARLMGIKSVAVFEDDLQIFPLYSKILVPFLNHQLCPEACSAAQWDHHPKTIKYKANHELAYLRPSGFTPDRSKVSGIFEAGKLNFFIRFAKLTAWHDEKKTGINNELAIRLVKLLEKHGRVHLSSERELPPELEPYRVSVKASDILHILAFADLYIGDSQTMTAEAAVLGTPAIRFNDFVGKLRYLEELEHTYHLTYGIKTDDPEKLFTKTEELINMPGLKAEWQLRKEKLLSATIDPTAFFIWFFENYPKSAAIMHKDPSYQFNFRS